MAYIGRLEHGNQHIDLGATGVYKIARSFVPPTVSVGVTTASGTSANTHRGASRVSSKAANVEWNIPLHVFGTTPDMVRHNIDRLNRMLARVGDEFNPVMLAFHHDSDLDFEPCWGQGWRRVEVVSGYVLHGSQYNLAVISGVDPNCSMILQCKPYPVGMPQKALDVLGGVTEDWIGSVDGAPLGTLFQEAITNLIANPYFANAAWNEGWTNSAHLTDLKNTDPEYILWGTASAYLYADGTDGTYTRSYILTGDGDYVTTAWIKKQDGSAVTASDCAIIAAGSAQSSTYISLGNGWYMVYFFDTSAAAGAYTFGLNVEANHGLYVAGMQFHTGTYPTAMVDGQAVGCLWGALGPHEDTSYRPASYGMTTGNDAISMIQTPHAWSCEFIVKPLIALSQYSNNMYLMHEETSGLYLMIEPSSDIMASDGTNVCDADGVAAITAGQIVTIHLTCGPTGGIKIYVDGVLAKTQATYAPPLAMGDLYIGGDKDGANQCNMTVMGMQFYNRELTAAQVAARYANILPIITAGRRVSALPWTWTRDGDGVIDYYTDDTHAHFAIVGGVPGDDQAETFIKLGTGGTSGITVASWLSDVFMLPGTGFYQTGSTISVNTSEVTFPSSTTMSTDRWPNEYRGRPTWMMCTVDDAGANLWGRLRISTTTSNHDGAVSYVTTANPATTLYVSQSHVIPQDVPMGWARRTDYSDDIDYSLRLHRTVDGAANVSTTNHIVVFDYVFGEATDGYYLLYRGNLHVYLTEPPAALVKKAPVNYAEAYPCKFLHIVARNGVNGADDNGTTCTIYEVYVTPRYHTF